MWDPARGPLRHRVRAATEPPPSCCCCLLQAITDHTTCRCSTPKAAVPHVLARRAAMPGPTAGGARVVAAAAQPMLQATYHVSQAGNLNRMLHPVGKRSTAVLCTVAHCAGPASHLNAQRLFGKACCRSTRNCRMTRLLYWSAVINCVARMHLCLRSAPCERQPLRAQPILVQPDNHHQLRPLGCHWQLPSECHTAAASGSNRY